MEQIADYQLTELLGEGNHGQFFLAVPPPRLASNVERVAVKVMAASTTETAFRRASRELRAFASAQSPYLVKLLDAGQEGGRFFYAMEYFPLGSLGAPSRELSRAEKLRAVGDAAKAAHALHEVGVVHRSIKPGNILLVEDGARLSDLGLAQLLAPGQTVTGFGPVGTVEYMDPAILHGQRASRASDIWSLGVTLHRAITGQGVYGDLPIDDPLFCVRAVLSNTPTLSERLSESERALLEACLAADPAQRPPTAAALADRIEGLSS